MTEFFAGIVNSFYSLAIFAKTSSYMFEGVLKTPLAFIGSSEEISTDQGNSVP